MRKLITIAGIMAWLMAALAVASTEINPVNVTSTVAYPITVAHGGTNATSAATARTNLGLGSIATQASSAVSLTGGTVSGLTVSGHVKSAGTAPTATVNANAGTGATCTVTKASDAYGQINLTTTAVVPGAGEVCKVNFNAAYGAAPVCVLNAASANAGAYAVIQSVYTTTTTAILSVNFDVADAVGRAYVWTYHCAETN